MSRPKPKLRRPSLYKEDLYEINREKKRKLKAKYPHIDWDQWSLWSDIPDPIDVECPVCHAQRGMMCERRGTILSLIHKERGEPPKYKPFIWSWRSAHKRWRKVRRRKIFTRKDRYSAKEEIKKEI